jgi:hypothetical protein
MFNFLTCNGLVSDMYSGSEMYLTAMVTAITLSVADFHLANPARAGRVGAD